MCLILVAWQAHPDYPLVVAANRDEFFARPAAPAAWWPDAPHVFAGRDLEAGGTWLGLTRTGRFAGLTNFRDPGRNRAGTPSRGALVADFLGGGESTAEALARLQHEGPRYNAFNLFVSDGNTLGIYESESGNSRLLEPGVHALSNHLLDTPWPKLKRGLSMLRGLLERQRGLTPDEVLQQLAEEEADEIREARAAAKARLREAGKLPQLPEPPKAAVPKQAARQYRDQLTTMLPAERTTSGARPAATETAAVRIARLEVENARLRAEKVKVETERDILRKAAKYFAGETNW